MKENARFIAIIVAVVILVGGAWYALNRSQKTPAPTVTEVATVPDIPAEAPGTVEPPPEERTVRRPASPFQVSGGAADSIAKRGSRPVGAGSIKGTAKWADNEVPVSGAVVRAVLVREGVEGDLQDEGPEWTDETAADGTYRVKGFPQGSYALIATTEDALGVGYCEVTEDEPDGTVDLELRPAGFISGTVVNERGEPIDGALVFPDRTQENQRGVGTMAATALHAVADDKGRFMLEYLWAADYKLTVKADDYAVLTSDFIPTGTEDATLVLTKGANVRGEVVAAEDGEPVAGIKVAAAGENYRAELDASTDAEGRFEIVKVADGKYTVSIDDETRLITGKAPEITVAGSEDVEGLRLIVAMGGVVTGQAFDADSGKPLEGVRIRATSPGSGAPLRDATTDANGLYRLEGLAEGPYTVGRRWYVGYLHGERREDKKVNVKLGETVSGIDFPMKYGLKVFGRVLDEEGRPIDHVQVESQPVNNYDEGETTFTKEDGTFEHRGYSPNQKITITAAKPGYSASPVGPLDLGETDLTGVEIVMGAGSSIAGIVVDTSGKPLARVSISAMPANGVVQQTTTGVSGVDVDGSFKIAGLAPGDYNLVVRARGSYSSLQEPSAQVSLSQGQHIKDLRVVYEPAGGMTITGRVTNRRGEPVARANVNAYMPRGGSQGFTNTDDEGRYEISGLQDGVYRMSVFHQEYSRQDLEDVAAGSTNINLVLEGRGTVEGRVLDARSGKPVTNFRLSTFKGTVRLTEPWMDQNLTAFFDPNGNFKLTDVETGDATLLLRAEGYAPAQQQVPNVRAGATVSGVVFRLEPGASIEGTVTNAQGQPVSGARIYLGDVPYAQWQLDRSMVATTDTNGHFTLASLGSEVTRVAAVHADYAPGSADINVTPGGVSQVTIVLGGGGIVEGVVRMDGAPAGGQTVMVHQPQAGGRSRQGQSGPDGSYSISGVPEGEVYVTASVRQGTSFRNASQQAIVAEGQVTVVDFDFAGGTAVIEGTVTMDGQPLQKGEVGAVVTSVSGASETFNGQLDGNGFYRIEGLPGGAVTLYVNFPTSAGNYQGRMVQVTAIDGRVVRQDIDVNAGAKVVGAVSGVAPGELAVVVLLRGKIQIPTFDRALFMQYQGDIAGVGQIRPDGTFSVNGVEPGDYTVFAYSMGTTPPADPSNARIASQFVSVSGEGEVQVNLTLP